MQNTSYNLPSNAYFISCENRDHIMEALTCPTLSSCGNLVSVKYR